MMQPTVQPDGHRLFRSSWRKFLSPRIALLLLCFAVVHSTPSVFGQTASLQTAWQQKVFQGAFSDDRTTPKIDHGFLISFRRTLTDSSESDAIRLDSLDRNEHYQLPFWPERAMVAWIADVSVTSDKHLIIVGSLLRQEESSPRHFASEVDFEGHIFSSIDFGNYEPELTCTAGDGSVWVLGQDWDAETSRSPYRMLRNYSREGHLIRSALSRKDVPYRVNLSARLHHAGGGPGKAFLVCGDKIVGVYIGPAITWVEVALSDSVQRTWRVKLPPPRARITGLALLGEEVYGSFNTASKDGSNPQRGLYKLNLSQQPSAVWEPVDGTIAPTSLNRSFSMLMGSDGLSLVYLRNEMVSPEGVPILLWSKPSD
jgi:hypothetical protein